MTRVRAVSVVAVVLALVLGVLFAGQAGAVDGDNALTYRGGAQGRVIFDGRTHASKGLVCSSCHSALFATAKTGLISMSDHGTDKSCFACHNGKQAFDVCTDCHRQVQSGQ